MRFYFSNMARPKRVAQLLKIIFPMQKLAGAQEWAARLYGYRDWHELVEITKAGKHTPNKFDEELPQDERLARQVEQGELIQEMMNVSWVDSSMVVGCRLRLTSKSEAGFPRKAEGVPSGGGALFNILRYEVFGAKKSEADHSDTPEIYASTSVPKIYGTEKSVIAKLLKMVKAAPSDVMTPKFFEHCKNALSCDIQEGVTWDYAESEQDTGDFILRQTDRARIFLFDRHELTPRGFLVYELFANGNRDDDTNNELELKIIGAWAEEDDNETWSQIIGICAGVVVYVISQLSASFNAPKPDYNMRLSVMLSTENSVHLMDAEILQSIAELATDQLGLDEDPFHIAYDL